MDGSIKGCSVLSHPIRGAVEHCNQIWNILTSKYDMLLAFKRFQLIVFCR